MNEPIPTPPPEIHSEDPTPKPDTRRKLKVPLWVYELLLVLILLVGAALRLRGIYWGEFTYMHPDERFLVWVGTDIQPIGSETLGQPPAASMPGMEWRAQFPIEFPDCTAWGGYFDASCSPLNPNNRGHAFYVYGTLPMFFTRYMVEWIYSHTGFAEMTKVGRPLSTIADLLMVFLVYLTASRLYNRRVGLLAAAFSALAALQIQQSHFFTMDTFITLFTMLALYFAVRIGLDNGHNPPASEEQFQPEFLTGQPAAKAFFTHPYFWLCVGFGVALGMAAASKLNAVLMAWILPAAMLVRLVTIPAEKRSRWVIQAVGYLVLAGFLSLLVFRIFQPYAFTGPGFFGLKPNPMWVSNIKNLMAQGAGDVDFPPSLQWARRTILYSGQNLVLYGLGLPLGLLAWAGFVWVGWRILGGQWQRHILVWGWTAFYFGWQSLAFNPTMRYQLPVYPTLAIFAAWAVIELYDRYTVTLRRWYRPLAVSLGAVVLLLTLGWAVAFSNIYVQPFTRAEASRWIFQNIPGPFNLAIQTGSGVHNQIIPFSYNGVITSTSPHLTSFTAQRSGTIQEINLPHITDRAAGSAPILLDLTISLLPDGETPLGTARVLITLIPGAKNYVLQVDNPIRLIKDQSVYLTISEMSIYPPLEVCGQLTLGIESRDNFNEEPVAIPAECAPLGTRPLSVPFTSPVEGRLSILTLGQANAAQNAAQPVPTLTIRLSPVSQPSQFATGSLSAAFESDAQGRGTGYSLQLEKPFPVEAGLVYQMEVSLISGGGSLHIEGSAIANEGDWDDGLPLRLENYDGFGGIYTPGLNFNMYTEENPEKLHHFLDILDQTEYILISSNRQWGSLPRLPERFPLSTVYYRSLLGCPADKTIFWCYAVAKPGMFQGSLGFELVHIQQSNPSLGPIEINDQFAEEAFHVYEHPKVLIFRKTEAYDADTVAAILGSVDLTQVVRITPKKAGPFPADLLLPADRLTQQQTGGTWSDMFNAQALHNRFQILGVIGWYVAIWLIGLLAYPLVRLAMPGLADRGYPLARTAGLLILAYLVWLASSARLPFSRLTISLALLLMAAAAGWLAYLQRQGLHQEWSEKRRYFLMIEGLILGFFLLFLLVRLGNPDLWHPWKGGEKPMDFAYFNAVLKSTSFPPYDPWFAGGYLNYYYYGFVIAGVPVKFLGIVPSFAYNLILATMFSLTSIGAFSMAWNLGRIRRFFSGMAAVLGMAVLGNLGTLRMILRGYQGLVDPKFLSDGPGFFERLPATFQGMARFLSGQPLPYGIGDWYWNPSRVMPAGDNAITEMPAFTFLYADLHPHLFAMPIALLCLGGILAIVLGRGRWRSAGQVVLSLSLLALAIGALWPTNTWDFPTYLVLALVAVIYTFLRYLPVNPDTWSNNRLLQPLAGLPPIIKRLLLLAAAVLLLTLLANVLYLPYGQWYGQGYSSIDPWLHQITPLSPYFTHWGLFLFILVAWMAWESIDWMARTPLASLRKLDGYWEIIWIFLALLLAVIAILAIKIPLAEPFVLGKLALGRGVAVAVITLPLAAWAGVLLLRPGQPDAKRFVLFLTGTALIITLVVELVVLRGDIGRQNTVFKLYLQAWTLFAICAAAALAWIWSALPSWTAGWKIAFQTILILLVGAAALFPILGGTAKIRDRIAGKAPITLDGMAYMQTARYNESGTEMDLSQDYRLIRWMQDNIAGSQVIVEANSGNLYRWYSRITVYTGLPGVVGWEWHQQQQRSLTPPDWVSRRLHDINEFYLTDRLELAQSFLAKYNVHYIVFGQLERVTYPGPGLDKFAALNGVFWQEVYRDQQTILYQVIQP